MENGSVIPVSCVMAEIEYDLLPRTFRKGLPPYQLIGWGVHVQQVIWDCMRIRRL